MTTKQLLTIADRATIYNGSIWAARFPASRFSIAQEAGHDVAYARWLIGQRFRSLTGYHGSYPPTYLERVMTMFPDITPSGPRTSPILHAFSGSLPRGAYARVDDVKGAEYPCNVLDLWKFAQGRTWQLVLADPPYTELDAKLYGLTKLIGQLKRKIASGNTRGALRDLATLAAQLQQRRLTARARIFRSLAAVTAPGGHLVWLDNQWPQHARDQWTTVARIALTTSTNRILREVTMFERV